MPVNVLDRPVGYELNYTSSSSWQSNLLNLDIVTVRSMIKSNNLKLNDTFPIAIYITMTS